jgi:membrane fusion protein (multidrug efflux system)
MIEQIIGRGVRVYKPILKSFFLLIAGVWFPVLVFFVLACSSGKDRNRSNEKFPVTSPIVIDTVYSSDYVADIHSLQNVELRARVQGYVEKILVDEGQSVRKGQVLFSISSQGYKEELVKAKAMLKSAIADAKAAELDLKNVKTLVDKSIVSTTELEMAQSKLDALNAKIEEAQSHEASAQLRLSYTEIRAPFDGIIDRIPNKIGSLIDEGTLLTTISDNKEIFAYFKVSEKEYLDFTMFKDASKKKNISLILANNQIHKYKGTLETIEGEFDKSTGSIAFRVRFPNPDHLLKHGSSGKIRLKNEVKNALIIPQKSTFEIQDKTYVFVLDGNNKVETRNFVSNLRIPQLYMVESGLSPNDKIIYEGIQNVKEGENISPEFISLKEIIQQLTSE